MRELLVELRPIDGEIDATISQLHRCGKRLAKRAAREFPCQVGRGFTRVRSKCGDINQRFDIVCITGRVRNNLATIGMPDKDDRPLNVVHHRRDVSRITRNTAQRIRGSNDIVSILLQDPGNAIPARRVGKGTMNQDNGRLSGFGDCAGRQQNGGNGKGGSKFGHDHSSFQYSLKGMRRGDCGLSETGHLVSRE